MEIEFYSRNIIPRAITVPNISNRLNYTVSKVFTHSMREELMPEVENELHAVEDATLT